MLLSYTGNSMAQYTAKIRISRVLSVKRHYARIYHGKRAAAREPTINTNTKWLAFDIETANFVDTKFEASKNYKSFQSPGIATMATLSNIATTTGTTGSLSLWHNKIPQGDIGEKLSTKECLTVVEYLEHAVHEGYTIVTWNGLGFDFPLLALEVPEMESRIQNLARHHVDLMFLLFCVKGFPLSMESAAAGMGLMAKTQMKSEEVPVVWRGGNADRQRVLDYVSEDVNVTLQLVQKIEIKKELRWISKTGKKASVLLPNLHPVAECIFYPLPDTSWMKHAPDRDSFAGWLS